MAVKMNLTDTGENGTNWPVYFPVEADSYSSLGHVGKIRLWTIFKSSPVSVKDNN